MNRSAFSIVVSLLPALLSAPPARAQTANAWFEGSFCVVSQVKDFTLDPPKFKSKQERLAFYDNRRKNTERLIQQGLRLPEGEKQKIFEDSQTRDVALKIEALDADLGDDKKDIPARSVIKATLYYKKDPRLQLLVRGGVLSSVQGSVPVSNRLWLQLFCFARPKDIKVKSSAPAAKSDSTRN